MTAISAVNPLDIRTCISQVQTALTEAIDLAYRYRYPAAATVEELRSLPSLQIPDKALRFVTAEGVVYRLVLSSRLPENLPYVVVPSDRTTNGRWVRQSTSVTLGPSYQRYLHRIPTGYARAVEIYQGQPDEELERIYGQMPYFLVEYLGDNLTTKGYAPGTIYEFDLDFVIRCGSRNYRPGQEALLGSQYPNEEDTAVSAKPRSIHDPGLYRMMGDIRYLLAGCDLGLAPGVKTSDIQGEGRIGDEDLAQRRFEAEVPVKVWASVHVVDEDLVSPIEIWIQRQDAGALADDGKFDAGNYVAQGYKFSPQTGFAQAPSSGVAYIRGQLVASAPGVHTFEPSADTYRDLFPDGSLFYQAVPIEGEAPNQPANTLRLGLTRTDANGITDDVLFCSYRVNSGADPGDPFKAS